MSKHKLAIDNSKMPEGYQQTEVGVIPEDWDVKTIGDIGSVSSGGTPSRTNPLYWDGSIPWITTTQIDFNIIDDAEQFITQNGLNNSAAKLFPPGTLLMAMYGQGKTRGKVAILGIEASTNQACAAVYLNNNVDNSYVFHSLVNQYEAIRNLSNTGNQENLNGLIIKSIKIALPPISEQRAIAQTLSDVDGLIAALDKAIAKKRNIKTATMQQLLTGKKRLPGFGEGKGYKNTEVGVIPEDWRCLRISEVVVNTVNSIKIGPFGSSLKREYLTRTGYKVYGQENIYERDMSIGERFINEERFIKLKSCEVCSGDFLISMMGTVGKCLVVPEGIKKGIMDSHLLRLKLDRSKIDSSVLNYLFEYKIIFDQVKLLSVGGVMEGLSSKIIKSIYLPLASLLEQRAIASILSDMDAEIAALEKRRAKTQAMKQGMMQELLTGKTRLIDPNNP